MTKANSQVPMNDKAMLQRHKEEDFLPVSGVSVFDFPPVPNTKTLY